MDSGKKNKTIIEIDDSEETATTTTIIEISDTGETTTSTTTIIEIDDTEETVKQFKQFKQFDIVTDYSDHHYANGVPQQYGNYYATGTKQQHGNNGDCFASAGKAVRKKIMQEWKILEENLPDSIFVRAYEGRIDLLRFVIIGAAGTPYHNGLFFFDLLFPSNYPSKPPKVYYHSHGLRLNPNLYNNGYVCLSLLNTWQGSKEQKWIPSKSTILQVLVSIQGLVLNENPYFNEPAYAGSPVSLASRNYNEQVYALSCKTMLYLLRNPPKNFEGFVAQHFCERGEFILKSSEAYMEGRAEFGSYQADGSSSSSSQTTHLKGHMGTVLKDLEKEFNKLEGFSLKKAEEKDLNRKKDSSQRKSGRKRKTNCFDPQDIAKRHEYTTSGNVITIVD